MESCFGTHTNADERKTVGNYLSLLLVTPNYKERIPQAVKAEAWSLTSRTNVKDDLGQ